MFASLKERYTDISHYFTEVRPRQFPHSENQTGVAPQIHGSGCDVVWSSPLSFCWKWKVLTGDPGRFEGNSRKVMIINGALLPLTYGLGMMGHALALPIRIFRVFTAGMQALWAVITLPCRDNRWQHLKVKGALFGVSILEVFTCTIGVICPVAAYKLEYCIACIPLVRDNHSVPWLASDMAREVENFLAYLDRFSPEVEEAENVEIHNGLVKNAKRARGIYISKQLLDNDDISVEALFLICKGAILFSLMNKGVEIKKLLSKQAGEIDGIVVELKAFVQTKENQDSTIDMLMQELARDPETGLSVVDDEEGDRVKIESLFAGEKAEAASKINKQISGLSNILVTAPSYHKEYTLLFKEVCQVDDESD